MGVVWGDVKPNNILVDNEGTAWIIDFRGGFSPGWVDESIEGTEAGDLQGVEKIKRYLEADG